MATTISVVFPTYDALVTADKPSARWRLGEASGNAADSSGNMNTATAVGGITYGVAGALTGDANTAVTFNGTTGYFNAPYTLSTHPGDTFSIEFWIKTTAAALSYIISGGANGDYAVYMDATGHIHVGQFGVGDIGTSTATVNNGLFRHVVWTKDGATNHLYIDGAETPLTSLVNRTIVAGGGSIVLGQSELNTFWLAGSLDEVAVYNYPLALDRINAHVLASSNAGLVTDMTPALQQGSLTLKFNTADFQLLDPNMLYLFVGGGVVIADPAWTGAIASIISSDPVDLINNHELLTIAATNTSALPNDTAPFDLSDAPVAGSDRFLLEDGSGYYALESGTDWAPGAFLIEQPLSKGYSGLSVQTHVNPGGPNLKLGRATTHAKGLRPGNKFKLTSTNQSISAAPFQITQVVTTWPELQGDPVFQIEFGDTPATLAAWMLANAAPVPTVPAAPLPPSTTILGACASITGLQAAGGGIVTVATATFTVSVPTGRTLTCQVLGGIDAQAYGWNNYVAVPRRAVRATLSGAIYTGAWLELPGGGPTTSGARVVTDLSSAAGIALAAGTYTVTIDIDTQLTNQMKIFSGWAQVAVTTV